MLLQLSILVSRHRIASFLIWRRLTFVHRIAPETIRRATNAFAAPIENMSVGLRGFDIVVAQEFLCGSDTIPSFKQMKGRRHFLHSIPVGTLWTASTRQNLRSWLQMSVYVRNRESIVTSKNIMSIVVTTYFTWNAPQFFGQDLRDFAIDYWRLTILSRLRDPSLTSWFNDYLVHPVIPSKK